MVKILQKDLSVKRLYIFCSTNPSAEIKFEAKVAKYFIMTNNSPGTSIQ